MTDKHPCEYCQHDDHTHTVCARQCDICRRLEYLRGEIKAERISTAEIAELQSLVQYIEAGDIELLEAAGVPENTSHITKTCPVCEGLGYLVIEGRVERCDECMQYPHDPAAEKAFAHADLVGFVNAIGPATCFDERDTAHTRRNGEFTPIRPIDEGESHRLAGFLSDWSGDCRDRLRQQLVLAGCTLTFSKASYHYGYTNGTQCIEYIEGDLLVYPNAQ